MISCWSMPSSFRKDVSSSCSRERSTTRDPPWFIRSRGPSPRRSQSAGQSRISTSFVNDAAEGSFSPRSHALRTYYIYLFDAGGICFVRETDLCGGDIGTPYYWDHCWPPRTSGPVLRYNGGVVEFFGCAQTPPSKKRCVLTPAAAYEDTYQNSYDDTYGEEFA